MPAVSCLPSPKRMPIQATGLLIAMPTNRGKPQVRYRPPARGAGRAACWLNAIRPSRDLIRNRPYFECCRRQILSQAGKNIQPVRQSSHQRMVSVKKKPLQKHSEPDSIVRDGRPRIRPAVPGTAQYRCRHRQEPSVDAVVAVVVNELAYDSWYHLQMPGVFPAAISARLHRTCSCLRGFR